MHLGVSESADGEFHARPSIVGQIARDAKAQTLVLSHFLGVEREHPRFEMFSLSDLRGNIALVRKFYTGAIVEAEDLKCIVIEE